jgi:hypothetical protein
VTFWRIIVDENRCPGEPPAWPVLAAGLKKSIGRSFIRTWLRILSKDSQELKNTGVVFT